MVMVKYTFDADGDLCCEHGKASRRTAHTEKNPNRDFFKCHDNKESCLFKWVDLVPELNDGAVASASSSPHKSPQKRPLPQDAPVTPTPSKRARLMAQIQHGLDSAARGLPVQPIAGPSSQGSSSQSRSRQQSENSQHSQASYSNPRTVASQRSEVPDAPLRPYDEDDDPFVDSTPQTGHVMFHPLVKVEESAGLYHSRSPSDAQVFGPRSTIQTMREDMDELDRQVQALEQSGDAKSQRIAYLEEENERLRGENRDLKEDLKHEKENVASFRKVVNQNTK